MTFQGSVSALQGFGVVGEIFLDTPMRAQPMILESGSAANNVIGRAFTTKAEGVAEAGGTGVFAGILCNPKAYASYGTTADGPLAPTLTLANEVEAEFLQMGTMIITLAAPANIGDWLVYATATGIISAMTPFGSVPGGSELIQGAAVDRYNAGPGLAVITIGTPNTYIES